MYVCAYLWKTGQDIEWNFFVATTTVRASFSRRIKERERETETETERERGGGDYRLQERQGLLPGCI